MSGATAPLPRPHSGGPRARIAGAVVIAALLGFYTQATLFSPIYLPYALFMAAGACGLVLHHRQLPAGIFLWLAVPPAVCGAALAVTGMVHGWEALAGQVRSLVLMGLTLPLAAGCGAAALEAGRARMARIATWALVLAVAGAVLEIAGPLRALSDAVRGLLYLPEFLYAADGRDLLSHGIVRPKLFTAEPSYLARGIALFGALAVLLQPSATARLWVLLLVAAGALIVRSPAVLPALVVGVAQMLWFAPGMRDRARRLQGPVLLVLPVLLAMPALWLGEQVGSRLGLDGDLVEASAYMRLVHPVIMAGEVLAQRPFLGFGLGADASLAPVFIQALGYSGIPEYLMVYGYELSTRTISYGTFYAGLLLQLGLAGGLAFLLGLHGLLVRLSGGRPALAWLFILSAGIFVGPINTPALWAPVILVAVALRQQEEGPSPLAPAPSGPSPRRGGGVHP